MKIRVHGRPGLKPPAGPTACFCLLGLGRTGQRGKATEARGGERKGVPFLSIRADGESSLSRAAAGGARAPPAYTLPCTPPALRSSHRRQKASARLSSVSFSLHRMALACATHARRFLLAGPARSFHAQPYQGTPSPTSVTNPVLLLFRD
jgi:hypothetical protein